MKTKHPINYKLFKECIESIEKQLKSEQEHAENLAKCFPNASNADFMLESDFATNQLIKVLETLFNDKGGFIKNFCFDLDFGKNGISILKNTEELYKFIVQNLKINKN